MGSQVIPEECEDIIEGQLSDPPGRRRSSGNEPGTEERTCRSLQGLIHTVASTQHQRSSIVPIDA